MTKTGRPPGVNPGCERAPGSWAARITAWRLARRLSVRAAAELVRVPEDSWRAWERGRLPGELARQAVEARMAAAGREA